MTDVSSTSSTTSTSSTSSSSGKEDQTISSTEFMEIMVAELTAQDPFEPMSNADLVNQMSIIQQMQSNQTMTDSFEELMTNFDTLISRNTLNTASGMVGDLVSGLNTSGSWTTGTVTAVYQDGDDIYLQLNTGEYVNWEDVERLGGNSSEDIVGKIAVGLDAEGETVVGEVTAVELNEEEVTLHVTKFEDDTVAEVKMSNASLIEADTADLLIGRIVKGPDVDTGSGINGYVESVVWQGEGQVKLNVVDSDGAELGSVMMDELTYIS